MARALIEQIDILRVFRGAGVVFGTLAGLMVAATLAFHFEPRDEIGHQKLLVLNADWRIRSSRNAGGYPVFQAEVVLPNGKTHAFSIRKNDLDADGTLCALVEMGRWFDAYHIDITTPERCRGLGPPKDRDG